MKKTLIILLAGMMITSCKKPNQLNVAKESLAGLLKTDATPIQVTLDQGYSNIIKNGFGYSTRFNVQNPWEQITPTNYNALFVASKANMLRFPGGTVASYWNYNTGYMLLRKYSPNGTHPFAWVDTGLMGPEGFCRDTIQADAQKTQTLADLKTVVTSSGADVVWVMNIMTPGRDWYASSDGWNRTVNDHPGTATLTDDWYKMLDGRYTRFASMLHRAIDTYALPVHFIEIGNEQYWDTAQAQYYSDAFPGTGTTGGANYAIAANYIAGKLRAEFGTDIKIAAVANGKENSVSSRQTQWNQGLVSKIDNTKIQAVSMHTYSLGDHVTTYTEASFQNMLGNWGIAQDNALTADNATAQIFNNNWDVWWTEVTANHATDAGSVDNTWAHALLQVFSSCYLVDWKHCTMFLETGFPQVIYNKTQLNSIAYALQPLFQASHNAVKQAHLNFVGVALLPNYGRKVIEGMLFQQPDGTTNQCMVANFTASQQTVDMTGVYPSRSTLTVSGWKDGINATSLGSTTLTQITNHTANTNSIVLEPYSVSFIR